LTEWNPKATSCAVAGCADRRRLKRGLCPKHYQKWRKYGDPEKPPQPNAGRFKRRPVSPEGFLQCRPCGQWLPPERFRLYKRTDAHGNPADYWDSFCKSCRVRATKEWRRANPLGELEQRKRQYAARYGLTISAYESLFEEQAGRCGICGEPREKRLGVDHDHATGAVRGLLCGNCNRGLGMFMDNVDLLRRAITWLEVGGTTGGLICRSASTSKT
jgi:Recombination endonuclease VII